MQKTITTFFIDLDGTVYDRNNGMMEAMTERIALYVEKVLHVPHAQVPSLMEHYYQTYGSSLRGLQQDFVFDPKDYLAFVHDLDLDAYLKPDPVLRESLISISTPKWIFTNSDRNHALRVLDKLEITDCFEGILDVWTMEYVSKPHPWVYHHALEMAGDPDPWQCVFIDDSARNLKPAAHIGFSTIWVGEGALPFGAHLSMSHLHNLPAAFELIEKDFILPDIFTPLPQLQPFTY